MRKIKAAIIELWYDDPMRMRTVLVPRRQERTKLYLP